MRSKRLTYGAIALGCGVLALTAWQGRHLPLIWYSFAQLEADDLATRQLAVRRLGELGALDAAKAVAAQGTEAVLVRDGLVPGEPGIWEPRTEVGAFVETARTTLVALGARALPRWLELGGEFRTRAEQLPAGKERDIARERLRFFYERLAGGVMIAVARDDAVGVVEVLRNRDAEVRTSAATILKNIAFHARAVGVRTSRGVIITQSPLPEDVLALEPVDEIIPVLSAALADTEDTVRDAAGYLLGAIGPRAQSAIPLLIERLEQQDNGAGHFYGLKSMGQAAIEPLLGCARRVGGGEVIEHCAMVLAQIGDESIPFLLKSLSSPALGERQCAGAAIAKCVLKEDTARTVVARLSELRTDSRWHVSAAISKMGDQAAGLLPDLVPLLKGPAELRRVVAFTLGSLGSPASGTVPALRDLAKSEDSEDRWYAQWALDAIAKAERLPKARNLPR